MFTPNLTTLPPAQRALWRELSTVPPEFVLYGGTAIALHLGHRESMDFDFFGNADFNPGELYDRVPFLAGSVVVQSAKSTLTCRVERDDAVMVSFFGLPKLRRVELPHSSVETAVRVATLLDLAGTKAAVVQQRAEAKDFIDIDALIRHGIELPRALGAAAAIYGPAFNPQVTLKALCYFGDGNLSTLPAPLRGRIVAAVDAVDLNALPHVAAVPQ